MRRQQCEFQESLWKAELLFPQYASWPIKYSTNEIINFLWVFGFEANHFISKLFRIKIIVHVTQTPFGFATDQPAQTGSLKQATKTDWQSSSIKSLFFGLFSFSCYTFSWSEKNYLICKDTKYFFKKASIQHLFLYTTQLPKNLGQIVAFYDIPCDHVLQWDMGWKVSSEEGLGRNICQLSTKALRLFTLHPTIYMYINKSFH